MESASEKSYFTAIEYADMQLPGLPITERGIQLKANKEHWEKRPRQGRGGGWEFAVESLPVKARMAFERTLNLSPPKGDKTLLPKDPSQFNIRQRKVADKRFAIVTEFNQAKKNVPPKFLTKFTKNFSKNKNTTCSTLNRWCKNFQHGGYQALIPGWNNGDPQNILTPEMRKFIEKAYLQPYGPPIKKVHEDLCKAFADKGQRLPAYRTVAAFIDSKWTPAQQLLIRDKEAWNRLYDPHVRRDWQKCELNELWISDHKQLDVACLFRGKVIFPWLTAIEEALSRKFIGWILVPSPNALAIGQAFLYAVSKYGAPKTFYCDRGKDYQSKYISGEKEKKDEDGNLIDPALPGLVANLGTEIFYAVGRNPREKIIEAAFGCFTDRLKDLVGYRGHSIKTRPKKLDHEIKAKNLLIFEELEVKIDELINDRNARPHATTKKTPDSFWSGFQAKIPSQDVLNFLLMDVHQQVTVKDSSVLLKGLLYRHDELFKLAGEKVECRRDPKDIRTAIIIYRDQVFCSATLETPDHYRSAITLSSVADAARIRKKIKKFRKEIIESEDVIDDPLKLAVELDQKEKLRQRDIRPASSKVISFHRREKLARNVSDTMRKSEVEGESQEANTAAAGGDILSRYLAATAGKSRPVGRF
ncbi:MAG: DNA-binding protein [Smithellaceae bacterium]|jgi:putative transposase